MAEPQPAGKGKMDWLFGTVPVEVDRTSVCKYASLHNIYWNSSDPDTNGTEESVTYCQWLNCTQEPLLGKEKVFFLERCPWVSIEWRNELVNWGSLALMAICEIGC